MLDYIVCFSYRGPTVQPTMTYMVQVPYSTGPAQNYRTMYVNQLHNPSSVVIKCNEIVLTRKLLVDDLANLCKMKQNTRKLTETLLHGYSSESTQQELSDGYQHNRVKIVFKYQ